jgi:hypothetical protein
VQKWIKFFGFMSGIKPKVSRLLRKHLSGESDSKEDVVAPIVGPSPGGLKREDIMNCGASLHNSNTREQNKVHENQLSLSSSGVQGQRAWGYGSPGTRLFGWGGL